jgi:hypothetical protein
MQQFLFIDIPLAQRVSGTSTPISRSAGLYVTANGFLRLIIAG